MIQKLKDRLLVETEYIGANVSCVSTQKGLVLIDTPFLPEDAREWKEKITSETGQEIAYIINTDDHFDHVMGNEFLSRNIICHDVAAKGLALNRDKKFLRQIIKGVFPQMMDKLEAEIDALEIPKPLFTFKNKLTLDMGDTTFILESVGGHSPGTILIYCPELKAAFAGDNVEAQFPFCGQIHYEAWKAVLQKMLAMDIDLVVPGHGPVGGLELVRVYDEFSKNLESEINSFQTSGIEIDEMPEKSQVINTFPSEPGMEAWIKLQYRSAAKAILSL